jgi:sugar-specific transcriptional regulator TrmB
MDYKRYLEALRIMGIEEKAAQVYIALLQQPKMTPSQISRETGIKRATSYEYIDALLAKGFVTREPIGKRIFYSATDPRKVFNTFRKQIPKIEGSMLEMSFIHEHAVHRPRVTYYEGKRQLKTIYDDLFRTVGDVYSIFPAEQFFENFSTEEYDEFEKSITNYALKSKDLFLRDKYYKRIKEIRAKNGGSKLDKRLPAEFRSKVDVLIFSDKVALISLRDLSAIVIENKDIAELFRSMHALIWRSV